MQVYISVDMEGVAGVVHVDQTRQPTAGILDSQSVKTALEAESRRGYDAGKKVKGRKRHLLVDVLGLVLVAWITTADVQDRDAAAAVLPLAAEQFPTLQKVWADGAYEGPRVADIAQQTGIDVEVVKRSDTTPGFVVQAKRWIVERTFGWLSRERRLSRDYERKEESSETFVYLGMIRLMLGRLALLPWFNTLSGGRAGRQQGVRNEHDAARHVPRANARGASSMSIAEWIPTGSMISAAA